LAHLFLSHYFHPAKDTTQKETTGPPLKTIASTKGTIQHRGGSNSPEIYRIGRIVGIVLEIPIHLTVLILTAWLGIIVSSTHRYSCGLEDANAPNTLNAMDIRTSSSIHFDCQMFCLFE